MEIKGDLIARKGCCYHNGKKYPRGSNCFYVRVGSKLGVKVYYGLDRKQLLSLKAVKGLQEYATGIAVHGVCRRPHGKTAVEINVTYRGERIKCKAYGIIVKHLDMDYHKGKDKFKKWLKQKMDALKIRHRDDYYQDGNIGWDKDKKRYFLVDWK